MVQLEEQAESCWEIKTSSLKKKIEVRRIHRDKKKKRGKEKYMVLEVVTAFPTRNEKLFKLLGNDQFLK